MSTFIHPLQQFSQTVRCDAVEEHDGKFKIGESPFTSLWLADDIDAFAEEEQDLETLTERLNMTCTRY